MIAEEYFDELGTFIGARGQPNRWREDVPINGISGWTAPLTEEQAARLPWNQGVLPAGNAMDLPGRTADLSMTWAQAGAPEEDLRFIDQAGQAIGQQLLRLSSAYDVPAQTVDQFKQTGRQALDEAMAIRAAGGSAEDALRNKILPWVGRAESAAAEYRHPQRRVAIEKMTTWERNLALYQQQLQAIQQAETPEEKALLEEQASLTKSWLDKQGKFAPPKPPTERTTEYIKTVPDPLGGTNTTRLTNWTHSLSRPLTNSTTPGIRRYNPLTRRFE